MEKHTLRALAVTKQPLQGAQQLVIAVVNGVIHITVANTVLAD